MSENHPVTHPLPEGVYDNFTYACNTCGGTVTVISSTRQPHTCPSTERNELAKVIVTAYGEDAESECPCEQDLDVADAILAAGYRKPQQVTTVEELDALPQGTIIMEALGYAWQKMDRQWVSWLNPGENSTWMASGRRGPFTVLHVGGAE